MVAPVTLQSYSMTHADSGLTVHEPIGQGRLRQTDSTHSVYRYRPYINFKRVFLKISRCGVACGWRGDGCEVAGVLLSRWYFVCWCEAGRTATKLHAIAATFVTSVHTTRMDCVQARYSYASRSRNVGMLCLTIASASFSHQKTATCAGHRRHLASRARILQPPNPYHRDLHSSVLNSQQMVARQKAADRITR